MKRRIKLFDKLYFYLLIFCLPFLGILYFLYPKIPIVSKETSTILPFIIQKNLNGSSINLEFPFLEVKQDFYFIFQFPEKDLEIIPLVMLSMGLLLILTGIIQWSKISINQVLLGLGAWLILLLIPLFTGSNYNSWLENIPWIWTILTYFYSIILVFSLPTIALKLSRSENWNQSFKKFLILSSILLINLIISLSNYLGWLETKFYLPLIFFLFLNNGAFYLISEKYIHNKPQKLILWGLGFIQIAWIIFQLIIQNDSAIKGFILWNSMSIIIGLTLFIPYLFSNFHHLFKQNLPFHRVILKAKSFPIYLAWIGTLLLLITWNFGISNRIFHLFQSGIYNHQGLWEEETGRQDIAKISYENGYLNSRKNYFSNFRLANSYLKENKRNEAEIFVANVLNNGDSELTGLFLSQLYMEENQPFEALFLLIKQRSLFKKSIQINNQIASIYESLQQKDSANYYYQLNYDLDPNNDLIKANYLRKFIHQFQWDLTERSSLYEIKQDNTEAFLANWNILNQLDSSLKILPFDSNFSPKLNVENFAYLNNAILNQSNFSTPLNFETWEKNSDWTNLYPEYELAYSWYLFFNGNKLKSYKNLINLLSKSQEDQLSKLTNFKKYFEEILINDSAPFEGSEVKDVIEFLNNHPFNKNALIRGSEFLNKHNQGLLAYQYCFDAYNLNPNQAELAIPYILQAYRIGEETYAMAATNQLKKVAPHLIQEYNKIIEKEKKELMERRKF